MTIPETAPTGAWRLDPDRYFSPDPAQRSAARRLYAAVKDLPLVCPHGHVDPGLFVDPQAGFSSPAELLIVPDHYLFRMLYSQGVPMQDLGVRPKDGTPAESDPRRIWQIFAEHFHLFRGTPSGGWLAQELVEVFGVDEKLTAESAQRIYDQIEARLQSPEFQPRALFERFNVEVLCTTDAASDPLDRHQALRASGWPADIRPTFRPDAVVNLDTPGWQEEIERLSAVSGVQVNSYPSFIQALETRRADFKQLGAVATDHAARTAETSPLTAAEAEAIFQRALAGRLLADDARRFTAHMLLENARMSVEDGLVMQLHVGSLRNYNSQVYARFGPDMGADIPLQTEFTRSLRPLLERYGNHPRFRLILFTLDESAYSRELAPLAGHYPVLRLGPPWWFHDSPNGMRRYLERVVETAGLYNLAGFNDDTRAFPSIPARHDVWRRVCSDWVAGLWVRGMIDEDDAVEMMLDLAYRLARRAYRLDGEDQGAGA